MADLRGAALKLTGEQKKKLRKRSTVRSRGVSGVPARPVSLATTGHPTSFQARASNISSARVELDPRYALAYAGLGDTIGAMSYYGLIAPAEGFLARAAAAERAIELDAELADPHVTLAMSGCSTDGTGQALNADLRRPLR